MSRTIRSAVLLVAFLSVVVLHAQGGAPASGQGAQSAQNPPPATGTQQNPQGVFRLGINYVRVDVIVTDKQGNVVTDLKPEDFEVFEDNKPQKVDSFKLINVGTAAQQQLNAAAQEPPRTIRNAVDEELEAARDDVRIFAIFLDDYHVRLGSSMAVRAPLMKFLQTQLGPNDLVELMYPLTPVGDLVLTRDHDAIAQAVQKFEGRKYDYRPRNMIEEQYQNYPANVIEQVRNQVSLSAIKGLVTHLGGLREGRKAVILVSEGYTNLLPPQLRDPIASMPGFANPARGNPTAGENDPREATARFFATADMQGDLRSVFDAANRSNTSIYTLDPRGLATSEFDVSQPTIGQDTDREVLTSTQDTLHVLADNTDGRAIVNRNDMGTGLVQVVRDSSAYYLLGYNSSLSKADGKFHEIKVRVKRPGTQVRARKGYWAPTEEERATAAAPPKPQPPAAITNALASMAETSRNRVVRTWIGTSRGDNGKTRVTFVWEPVAPAPGAPTADRPSRISLQASGSDGRPYFRGQVPDPAAGTTAGAAPVAPAASPAGDGTAASGVAVRGSRAVFDVPPGKLQLKMAVESTGAKVLDVDTREVDIPDMSTPQVRVTTPAVLTARTAREFRAIASDAEAVPTADRVFSRTERLLIRFDAYGPGYSVPTVTARLLSRAGQEMTALSAQSSEKFPEEHSIDLPLAGLAAGEYLVEIKAKGPAGEATEVVAIRVTA